MNRIFICFVFLCSCNSRASVQEKKSFAVLSSDTSLKLVNGVYFYQDNLFSGSLTSKHTNGNVHQLTNFINGKEAGWQNSYFENGSMSEKRYYTNGEKDSVHTGWWENGKLRFEYHFSKGNYEGDFKEWYESGNMLKHIHYVNGNDDWGKGWRENGKVYMNYAVKGGRRYGIINSNLCYSLKGENIKGIAVKDPRRLYGTANEKFFRDVMKNHKNETIG